MIIYLLKSSACLAIFMIFYKLFLERSSIHNFKRFYLLAALGLAFIIPSLTIIEYIEPVIYDSFVGMEPTSNFEVVDMHPLDNSINYIPIILWSIYGLGAFVVLLKFCLNLYRIIEEIKSNPKLKSGSFINVLIHHLRTPHTFFNYIFLNKYKFEHNEIPKEVILHEQTHAKQRHSVDILILELLQIVFWFNPLIYLLKRDIKLNHEFLADQAVLQNGIQPSTYQTILLAFSSKAQHHELANAINYSSIKKRFTVMKTHTSKKSIWLRSLLILPVLGILFYGFTERELVQRELTSTDIIELYLNENGELIIEDKVITYAEIEKLYNENSKLKVSIKIYPDAPLQLKDQVFDELRAIGIKKISVCTSQVAQFLPTAQQSGKDKYYKNATFKIVDENGELISSKIYSELTSEEKKLLIPQIAVPEKIAPQPSDLNRWLDTKKYGIWYDEKPISNHVLNTYLPSSFSMFYESKLEKNAVNYGKHFYQVNLYSHEYYEKKYENGIKPLSSSAIITIKIVTTQEEATSEQLTEYNTLAKKYNEQPQDKRIIKRKDLERLEYLFRLMSAEQKKNAQPFPDCPPPPPAPPVKVIKSEITWILLNSKGQFLVNDKLSNLKAVEAEFKNISRHKSKSKDIVFRHDKDSPKDIVTKVNILIAKYNMENISDTLLPPPPPPPAPIKKGNGPNGSEYYPIPTPIPENASPEQRAKMQATIYAFEKKYALKVHQMKSENALYNIVSEDNGYKPTSNTNLVYRQNRSNPKTGFIKINGNPHYFVSIDNNTKYYNRQGFEVSKLGKTISSTQVNASDVIPGQYITKIYSDDLVVAEFNDNKPTSKKTEYNIPPPPPPISTLDFVIDLAKNNAKFFYKNEEISSDKAITLLKQNPELNVLAKDTKKKQPLVYISVEPIDLKKTKN